MTAAEKRYLDKVGQLPCVVCGATPVEIHHVRRYGENRKHSKVVPLCWYHHRGPEGLHHLGKRAFERKYLSQDSMLDKTRELLGEI